MKHFYLILLAVLLFSSGTKAESPYPIRGLCVGAPSPENVDEFADFIKNELAPSGLNLLILRIDYNYQYQTHPELVGDNPYSKADVKKLVKVCKENNIRLIPQINLLGHQSWQSKVGKLLEAYPEFDETPDIQIPKTG